MTDADMLSGLVGKDHSKHLLSLAERLPEEAREPWLAKILRYLTTQDTDVVKLMEYKHPPVGVREFMESKFYLGKKEEIYPAVMVELEEINSGKYDEIVLTGGIGSAKTTSALYSQAYQLYLLSCYRNPHAIFGLDRSTEIKIIFQSLSAKLAKGVDYNRFRALVEESPYFKQHFRLDPEIESICKFPNRIEIEPVAGVETGAIGQNVIGGIIDEVNFMAVVENSKQSAEGGTYDQATQLYNTIARRRKSRFQKFGQKLPGLLCLVSSKKVPGQFTDKKEAEAKKNPRIYIYNKRVWDIKEGFSKKTFKVFVGDETRQPRFVPDNEEVPTEDEHLIDHIPIDFRQEFEDDITKALRDIAGRSTLAIHPFLPRRKEVLANFGKRQSVFAVDCIDFAKEKVKIRKGLIGHHAQFPRWAHIDLGITSDHAGLVIGHVPKFVVMDRDGSTEMLPQIEIDGILEIIPPKSMSGEIDFASIRRVLYKLRDLGMPIRWLSLDSFQSTDTMQIMRQQGFSTGYVSVDKTMTPYDLTKQALYDGRVVAPKHEKLIKELATLERDWKKGKIDHPAGGSKDQADALAGVIYGLTTRRDVWAQHKIPIMQAISVSGIIRDMEASAGKQGKTS